MTLDKCVVVCNSSHFGRRVVDDLQDNIQRGSATFVWTCSRITVSKEGGYVKSVTDGLVVLVEGCVRLICGVEAGGHYPSSADALPYEVMESVPAKGLTVKKSPKNPHLVSLEPVAESTAKLSIQMLLPTADIRDRFLDHFSFHSSPTYNSPNDVDDEPPPPGDDDDDDLEPIFGDGIAADKPPPSSPPASALLATEPRRGVSPQAAAVVNTITPTSANAVSHQGSSILLTSCDTDYFHVADHKSFCTKALSKWGKWWKAMEKDSEKSSIFDTLLLRSKRPSMREKGKKNASKMTQVLLSCDAQLSKSSHELVVVTDTALFIVKRRDPSIIKAFLPICGIECIQLGTSEKTLSSGEVVMEWVVMVVLDLQLPVMTTSEDLRLRMDTRNKNLLASLLSRRFEAIKFARLPVTIQEDQLFWRKRTFLETKALRLAGKVKNTVMLEGLLRSTSEVEGPLSVMHPTALTTKVAFCAHTLELISALCEHSCQKSTSDEEKGFMARSTLTLAKELGVETSVLLSCLSYEVLRIRRGNVQAASATSKRRQSSAPSGFLKSGELLDHILIEHCGSAGEQYLRIQLSQMFEEFLHSPKQLLPDHEYVRYVRELAELLHGSEHYDALFPEVFKEMMAVIQVVVRKHLGSAPSDIVNNRALLLGGDFVTRFFLSPAIESPQAHGLVSEALELTQLQNLRIISKLFAALHTSAAVVEESELTALGLGRGFLNSGSKEDVTATRVLNSTAFKQMQDHCGPQLTKFFARQSVDRSSPSVRAMEHLFEDLLRGGVTQKVSAVALSASDNIEMMESFHRLMEPVAMGMLCSAWTQQQQRRYDDDEMKSHREVAKPAAPQALLTKAHDENRSLAARLAAAERTAEHHKTQWAASSESFRELKATVAHKDEEILRLRTLLREMDPHYFPRPMTTTNHSFDATNLQTPPPLPHQRTEDGPFLYHYQLPSSSKRVAVTSSSVFGCPLDSYHLHSAYSPQEGGIEPGRM